MEWATKTPASADRKVGKYLLKKKMLQYDVTQVVDRPTQVQRLCHSVLDLYLLSAGLFHHEVNVTDGISDPNLVNMILPGKDKQLVKSAEVNVYDFLKADDTIIMNYFEVALDRLPSENNIEWLRMCFKHTVECCLASPVPK